MLRWLSCCYDIAMVTGSKEDKRKLTNGVRQQNIEIMSLPYIERWWVAM